VFPLLCLAAVLGDSTNYWIGRWVGPKVFHKDNARFLNKEQLHRAHRFYEKHGGKTVSIARFIPVIRAFAPFVAGIGAMNYARFVFFSVIGTLAWMTVFVLGGFLFGRHPLVQKYFTLVCLIIILVICTLIVTGAIRQFLRARRATQTGE
jgi:membrane-associated protein